MGIAEEFTKFNNECNIGKELITSISSRYQRITGQLNKDFRNNDSKTANSFYVGSYGRDTAAQGISDLDIAYVLPSELYWKYDAYMSNGQSALLQAVKDSIKKTYPTSEVSGDGQVVVINFNDHIKFEVLPVFNNTNGTWTYPNANNGGNWQACNPRAEIEAIKNRNLASNHNLKYLCRMMRVWRDYNNVPISGQLIDTLAYQFIATWEYRDKSFLYHGYMARDFLKYLADQDKNKNCWRMPGSNSLVRKNGNFQSNALTHYNIAVAACELQKDEEGSQRRSRWRSIFGPTFPN